MIILELWILKCRVLKAIYVVNYKWIWEGWLRYKGSCRKLPIWIVRDKLGVQSLWIQIQLDLVIHGWRIKRTQCQWAIGK